MLSQETSCRTVLSISQLPPLLALDMPCIRHTIKRLSDNSRDRRRRVRRLLGRNPAGFNRSALHPGHRSFAHGFCPVAAGTVVWNQGIDDWQNHFRQLAAPTRLLARQIDRLRRSTWHACAEWVLRLLSGFLAASVPDTSLTLFSTPRRLVACHSCAEENYANVHRSGRTRKAPPARQGILWVDARRCRAGDGIARATVAQIELGNRSVSGLELARLSYLYARDIREFVAPTFNADSLTSVLLRAEDGEEDGVRAALGIALR